jgi:hypothetical protein
MTLLRAHGRSEGSLDVCQLCKTSGGIRLRRVGGLISESHGQRRWKPVRMVSGIQVRDGCTRLHDGIIQEIS